MRGSGDILNSQVLFRNPCCGYSLESSRGVPTKDMIFDLLHFQFEIAVLHLIWSSRLNTFAKSIAPVHVIFLRLSKVKSFCIFNFFTLTQTGFSRLSGIGQDFVVRTSWSCSKSPQNKCPARVAQW